MMKKVASGWRRGGKQKWLMPGKWPFTADMSRYGLFSAPAVGISFGGSDAVSSLGSTKWSSRIPCMSGLWCPAGMNETKPLREDTRTQLLRHSTHNVGGGGILGVPGDAVAGSSRAAYPSGSCGRCHRNRCRLREPESVSAIPAESTGLGGCHTLLHGPGLLHGTKDAPESRRRSTIKLASMEGFAGRLAAIEVRRAHAHSCGVRFESCDVGDACRVPEVEQPSATRSSHSARSWCREESHPFPRQAKLRGPITKRCASSPTSRPCRSTCKAGGTSGEVQKLTLAERRGSEWTWSQQHRSRNTLRLLSAADQEESPAAGQSCPRTAHSTHPSRVPWNNHCHTPEESAEGLPTTMGCLCSCWLAGMLPPRS